MRNMTTKGTQQQKLSYNDNQQTTQSSTGTTQSMINTTREQCFDKANICYNNAYTVSGQYISGKSKQRRNICYTNSTTTHGY
jgi:hypothetical protein